MTADDTGLAVSHHPGPVPGLPAVVAGSDYAELSRTIKRAGLLRRRPAYYSTKIAVNLLLLAGGWTVFAMLGRSWWQLLVAVSLGVMFTQTGFIGHDAGHRQISGSKRTDDLIGRIHGNLLIGLSYGWWISKHNRHHAHPNQIGRDPDIAGRAIAFTAGEDEKLDLLRRPVLTSRNIRGGWPTDLALGGLNHQIEHHLFPSMPRPSLRRARAPVREFCASRSIPYCETGLLASYAQVLRHLHLVGRPRPQPGS